MSYPSARAAAMTRVRSSRTAATRRSNSSVWFSEARAAVWAISETPKGIAVLRIAAATIGDATP